MVNYLNVFKTNTDLISELGEGNAYLAWSMALYLDHPSPEELASESLTDGGDDKKIDFIRLDQDAKKIVFAQGYYSPRAVDKAQANKASDLNTASAWLTSGNLGEVPTMLRDIIQDCREAIASEDVEQIDLLYVHNLPESVNVSRELNTAAEYLRGSEILKSKSINVIARELGIEELSRLYSTQESDIEVLDSISCPAEVIFTEEGPKWKAGIMSVPGEWLRTIFNIHQEKLFSANYRGFLGITKRRKINTSIRTSAETEANNFWVFNNGITILTLEFRPQKDGSTLLDGISVINGAQTTGSLGSIDTTKHDLRKVKVLCRVVQCSDKKTIDRIVKHNNTQNEITTWDQYSNNPEQRRIEKEFKDLGHEYSLKRGFNSSSTELGIEQSLQPLLAFDGDHLSASRGKNYLFDRKASYEKAFKDKKARHILFVYTLAKAINERKLELREKQKQNKIINIKKRQLLLFKNLRFKNYLIALTARCLESILSERVDSTQISFLPEAANRNNYSVKQLTALWLPIVNIILSYTESVIAAVGKDVSDVISEEGSLERTAQQVGTLIYASQATAPNPLFPSFRSYISPLG
jgi:hypothetical protein